VLGPCLLLNSFLFLLRTLNMQLKCKAAHQVSMGKIQEKLKETMESQKSMKSLERISNVMQTSLERGNDATSSDDDNNNTMMMTDSKVGVDALEIATAPNAQSLKGENKAPVKRGKRRKHGIHQNAKVTKGKDGEPEKRRPKYFCQF
jgi:hypothetical protein